MNDKLFNKNFVILVLGQIISLFGNAILRFALPLYILKVTNSQALFGIVTACSFLPMIILPFLGGILADRVNKRNIMVALDFFTAILVLSLFLVIGILPTVPIFIIVLMILYGISGVYQPTVLASIPVLVASSNITAATAIINQIGALAGLLGPIIGGMLFGMFNINVILIVSVICFTLSAIIELFLKIPFKRRANNGIINIVKTDFRDSKNYIRNDNPLLLKVIILVAVFNLVLSTMLIIGIPILIVDVLEMSDELLGISLGIFALGGIGGGIFTAIFSKKLKFANSYKLLLLASIFIAVMAIPLLLDMSDLISYIVITVVSFMIMAVATMFVIQMMAKIQLETPENLIGKVMALITSMAMIAQPIGLVIYGILFDLFLNNTGYILCTVSLISVIISIIAKRVLTTNNT